MRINKICFILVIFIFLFGVLSSIHAEPITTPPTQGVTAPTVVNPSVSQPSAPVTQSGQVPGQTPAVSVPVNIPPTGSTDPIPVQPTIPGQGEFQTPSMPVAPPSIPVANVEKPLEGYSSNWFNAWWFYVIILIILVIGALVLYALKEGKIPTEDKEDTITSKKKKNNKK